MTDKRSEAKTSKTINKEATRIMAAIFGHPWAITKEGLQTIHQIASREGDIEALLAKRGDTLAETDRVEMRGPVAILSVVGPIVRYSNIFTYISGAASAQLIAEELQAAIDNPAVSAIIMNYDSPGGQVAGINELANMIYAARDKKKIVSYCSGVTASAAYWLAAAGSQVVCDATCQLGSIGTVIGFRKGEDNTIEIVSSQSPDKRVDPETEAGRAKVLVTADAITDVFVRSVARFRGIDKEKVLSDFGKGGVLVGEHAVSAGLADRLGSLEELVASLQDSTNTQHRGIIMTKQTDQGGQGTQSPAITIETIKQDHPAVAAALIKKGATAELTRVKSVFGLKFPGHDQTIAQLALDGETTAEAAALKLVNLESAKREKVLADRQEDGDKMPKVKPGTGDDNSAEAAEEAALIAAAAKAGSIE